MLVKSLRLSRLARCDPRPAFTLDFLFRAWPHLCLLLLTAGCADSGPELAPTIGRVLLDGEAVAEAGVLFMPTISGPSASGSTDAEGNFRLSTNSRDGALVGTHQVAISKAETRGISADAQGLSGHVVDGGWQFIEYLPTRYSQPKNSGLTAEVVAGVENTFTFQLTESEDETK